MSKITLFFFALSCCITSLEAQIVVGIAGGTGSGKTTLAENIVDHFNENAILISQDSYYKDFSYLSKEERDNLNFDHPNSLDFSLLKQHLQDLKDQKSVQIPIYDFTTHSRSGKTKEVTPNEIIIVEGILLFADAGIREMLDIKIYIDTDDDIRFLRRLERDILDRGRTFEGVKKQYISTVKPMHKKYVEPSKAKADLVVYGVNENMPMITKLISSYLTP